MNSLCQFIRRSDLNYGGKYLKVPVCSGRLLQKSCDAFSSSGDFFMCWWCSAVASLQSKATVC